MRTYQGNKLPNFSFNILMMNCFIKCITFSASHIVKPQWRIMDAFFISFCFQAAGWKHTSIGRLKINTRSSWKQQLQNVVLFGLRLRLWFCCSHHLFRQISALISKQIWRPMNLVIWETLLFIADADTILLIPCFLLLYVNSYQKWIYSFWKLHFFDLDNCDGVQVWQNFAMQKMTLSASETVKTPCF